MEKKIKKENTKSQFPISGAKWIPYIAGWVFGVFNLIFWIIVAIVAIASKDKHKFIDRDIHTVVMIWGLIVLILLAIAIAIVLMIITLGFSVVLLNLF